MLVLSSEKDAISETLFPQNGTDEMARDVKFCVIKLTKTKNNVKLLNWSIWLFSQSEYESNRD